MINSFVIKRDSYLIFYCATKKFYSHLLAMTLAEEDEKRFEREKEWEDFKNNRLGAGGDSTTSGQLTE